MTKKKKKQLESNDSFLLAMLLSTISILAVSLKDYNFNLRGMSITFSVFVVPFILFISNYITKKHGFKTSLQSILVSSLIIIAFLFLIKDLVNQEIKFIEVVGHFTSYFVSLFVNLSIYYYILINFKENVFLIYFNYIFSILIHYLIYLLFLHNMVITDNFWGQYFISIIVQAVMITGLVIWDSRIERGIKKKKSN